MSIRTRAARATIHAGTRLSRTLAGRRPPAQYAVRVLTNCVTPLAAKLALRPGVSEVNGIRMWFAQSDNDGSGGEYHIALGTYEEAELRNVVDRLPRGGGFVADGAHFGYFSLAAAANVGDRGTVFAFEPTPSSASVLRRNVDDNHFEDIVTVLEGAASATPGSGSLIVSSISQMFNTLESETLDETAGSLPITLMTIDSVLEAAGWPAIHVMKMDVEGHEKSVLLGTAQTVERSPGIEILFEASGTSDERHDVSLDTMVLLNELDFDFFELDTIATGLPSTIDQLRRRMRMPRWQDSPFNVVARRS